MGSVLAAVAAAAAVFSHSSTALGGPQTLYHHSGKLAAFAQDGAELAWFTEGLGACNTVHVLSLANGLHVQLPSQSAHNVTCRFDWDPRRAVGLAYEHAHGGVIWTLPLRAPDGDYLLGAGTAPADRAERRFLEIAHTARGVGQWLGGIAGDGATLVYASTSVDYADEGSCLAGTAPCTLVKSGGGVYRIENREPVHVPRTGAAVEVAISGTAVAYVGTGGISKDGRPVAAADVPIEVVDARTGQEISNVLPQGVPLAIALSEHVLATLERTPLGLRLAWYDRATGQIRGSIPVPKTTSPSLTANDRLIVFHVGRSLRGVAVDTHHARVLARAAASPIGLSLEGGRLAWGENAARAYRIRALYVNGRG